MGKRFYRDRQRGIVGGVCAGLAEYFGVSPLLLRLIFVFWSLAGGGSVVAYVILWIVLPDKESAAELGAHTARRNVEEIGSEARQWRRDLQDLFGGEGQMPPERAQRIILLGGLVVMVGLVSLADALHLFAWFRLRELWWPAVLILLGVVMLNRALRR
jgi:phage shock protein C